MPDNESARSATTIADALFADFVRSGIFRLYLIGTTIGVMAFSLISGNVGTGLFIGGWVGLLFAFAVNEATPGYTMEGTWIDGQ